MAINMLNVTNIMKNNKIVTNIKDEYGTVLWPTGKKYAYTQILTCARPSAGTYYIKYRDINVGTQCVINDRDSIQLIATPVSSSFRFKRWTINGSVISTLSNYTMSDINTDNTIICEFDVKTTITVVTEGTGNATGGGAFWTGDTCTLTATETTAGWRFVGWYNGDQLVTTDNVLSFTVTAAITMRAIFSNEYTITTTNNGNGLTYGGTATYRETVTLSAFPNSDYIFSHWTHEDLYVSYDRYYTVTVTNDDTYKGWFCASGNALVKVSNLNPEVITSHGWVNVADSSKHGTLSVGVNEIASGSTRISFGYDSSQMPRGSSCRITFSDKDGNITTYTASNSTIYDITGYTEITFDVYMPA